MCVGVQNTRSMLPSAYMSLRHTSYFVLNSGEDNTQIIKVLIDRYIGHIAVITDVILIFCMLCTMSENLAFFLLASSSGKVWGDIYSFIWSKLICGLEFINKD